MSFEYAERRIKEALRQAKGNRTRARQQVIAWTFEDSKLLHELTKHHMTGIVAYHIDRIASGRAEKAQGKDKIPAQRPKIAKPKGDKFGMEILKAVAATNAEIFGLESPAAPRKRGQASQQHINALQQMASKSKTKPKSTSAKKKK
jgi:hypothetical protein